jgi:transcription elongation factor Elf1
MDKTLTTWCPWCGAELELDPALDLVELASLDCHACGKRVDVRYGTAMTGPRDHAADDTCWCCGKE